MITNLFADDEKIVAYGGDGGGGNTGGSSHTDAGGGYAWDGDNYDSFTSGGGPSTSVSTGSFGASASSDGASVGVSIGGVGLSQNSKGELEASMCYSPGKIAGKDVVVGGEVCLETDGKNSSVKGHVGIGKKGSDGFGLIEVVNKDVTITPGGRSKAEENWSKSNEFSSTSGSSTPSFSWSNSTKVICTELYRDGLIPREIWTADIQYSKKYFSTQTMRGYHAWGVPTVKLMRKHQLLRKILRRPTLWFAEDIAYRMGARSRPNYIGLIIRIAFFVPVCFAIGSIVAESNWKQLWNDSTTDNVAGTNI